MQCGTFSHIMDRLYIQWHFTAAWRPEIQGTNFLDCLQVQQQLSRLLNTPSGPDTPPQPLKVWNALKEIDTQACVFALFNCYVWIESKVCGLDKASVKCLWGKLNGMRDFGDWAVQKQERDMVVGVVHYMLTSTTYSLVISCTCESEDSGTEEEKVLIVLRCCCLSPVCHSECQLD